MSPPVPLEHAVLLALLLFSLGMVTVLSRRSLLFILLGLEIMLNAAGLAFVAGIARWGNHDGLLMFMLLLSLAAAELILGVALALQLLRQRQSLNVQALAAMKG